ncbi:hypothetical protein RBH29_14730 [Herbivorax sp. ANBcel31]|uniref:hypothetical protein n=1 Tax=Herbivorax sp. ANBcel31 TaxID=3069754 RepID=UPI0027AF1007|nr:hypothetical protein [Herbivorax sp. ANBcel31]MDQ2087682.1 hypothetical protein [Herbivorax sp. ANBcel31]
MGNKKDINLLPEEYRSASQRSSIGKKKEGILAKEVSDGVKGLMDMISSRVSSIQYEKSKHKITEFSKNLKYKLTGNLQQNTGVRLNLIQYLKNHKLRRLEKVLGLEKRDLIVSSKMNYMYCTDTGKVVIVDKDIGGEPCSITIKESQKVTIKCVKFFRDYPFVFPAFSEKNLKGDVVYVDTNEIWYVDKGEATLVLFKNNEPVFLKIDLEKLQYNKNYKELTNYLNNHKMLYLNKDLKELLIEKRGLAVEDILKISLSYIIYKEDEQFRVLLLDGDKNIYNEVKMNKLPNVNEEAWDILFSREIYDYIVENGYSFDNFRQDEDCIEYCQEIGDRKVCVMRCKI